MISHQKRQQRPRQHMRKSCSIPKRLQQSTTHPHQSATSYQPTTPTPETTPQPLSAYSTHHTQLAPWKRWVVSELRRQNIIPSKTTGSVMKNVTDLTKLSPRARKMMSDVNLSLHNDNKLIFVWNITDFRRQLTELTTAFPKNFFHTVAVKANPLEKILSVAQDCGVGAEAASLGELKMALTIHPPEQVMFDCPSKTVDDITFALQNGVGLTLDNLGEVARLDAILNHYNIPLHSTQLIGIRINPQIGLGALSTYSVSKPYSKFGVPITEELNDIKHTYIQRPYLNMIHVHAGSQSYSMDEIAVAIRRVLDLALEINNTMGKKQIHTIDIGGGLITNFSDEENTPSLTAWSQTLQCHCPELFTGDLTVITELGRRLLSKQGFALSQIEYVKLAGGRRVLLQHVGADVAVRTVYKPASWPLRATLFHGDSGAVIHPTPERLLSNALPFADVAGPCCIDDVLAPNLRPFPEVSSGDYIAFHDTGAYYHSAYSYYNMRITPALYAFEEPTHWEDDMKRMCTHDSITPIPDSNGAVTFEKFKLAGTVDEVVDFFRNKY